jgi:uncharacterized protein YkwD
LGRAAIKDRLGIIGAVTHRGHWRRFNLLIILALLVLAACNLPAPSANSPTTPTPFPPIQPTQPTDSSPWTGTFAAPAATLESAIAQAVGGSTPTVPAYPSPEVQEAADKILQAVNQLRMALGSPALEADPVLVGLAAMRARDMTARHYLDHNDPVDGRLLGRLAMLQAGYRGKLAEDLFAGQFPLDQLPPAVIDAWLKTALHRQVAVDAQYHYAGIGLDYDGTWWRAVLLLAEGR